MSTTTTSWSDALRESSRWRLLGLLFERPRGDWRGELQRLASEVDAADLRAAAAAAVDATEGFHLALLGPGGPVSPREIAYRAARDPGHVLAELAAHFDAFAFRPRREDPLDHVAVEVGFVAYLRIKQAHAALYECDEAVQVVAEAVERFTAEHLASYAPQLAQRLEQCDAGYLALAARALAARVGPGREEPAPAGADVRGCSLACGAAGIE